MNFSKASVWDRDTSGHPTPLAPPRRLSSRVVVAPGCGAARGVVEPCGGAARGVVERCSGAARDVVEPCRCCAARPKYVGVKAASTMASVNPKKTVQLDPLGTGDKADVMEVCGSNGLCIFCFVRGT